VTGLDDLFWPEFYWAHGDLFCRLREYFHNKLTKKLTNKQINNIYGSLPAWFYCAGC